jgi:hypothetical protein
MGKIDDNKWATELINRDQIEELFENEFNSEKISRLVWDQLYPTKFDKESIEEVSDLDTKLMDLKVIEITDQTDKINLSVRFKRNYSVIKLTKETRIDLTGLMEKEITIHFEIIGEFVAIMNNHQLIDVHFNDYTMIL